MRGAKGQVSVFIIIGVLILIFAVILILVSNAENSELLDEDIDVSSELLPVKTYVESCLNTITERGLQKAGLTGGYVDSFAAGLTTLGFDPTSSDAFVYTDDITIAYWHYLKSSNTCTECEFSSQRPSLNTGVNSIETQLDRYIRKELAACLQSFDPLLDAGYLIEERGSPSTEVLFTQDDVRFTMKYPLYVQLPETDGTIETFGAVIDIPFRQMYEQATLLALAASRFNFLERHTMNIINVHAGLDKNMLPPIADSEFEFASTKFWIEKDVQDKIQDYLYSYTPALQVQGAQNYRPIVYEGGDEAPAVNRMFQNMVLPFEEPIPFDVEFEYPYTPYYFNTNDDGVIRPTSVSFSLFPFFGIQRYNTVYDISYPVRVAIKDDEALNGEGYTFAFGIESNVRNNKPLFEGAQFQNPMADLVVPKQFCNPVHFTSEEVTIALTNAYTNEPAKEVQILYDCGIDACAIGTTDERGVFKGRFPVCLGGDVVLLAEDLAPVIYPLNPSIDEEVSLEHAIEPYVYVDVKLDIHRLLKAGSTWQKSFNDNPTPELGEKYILTFSEVKGLHTRVMLIDGDEQLDKINTTIQLIPGEYEITGQVIYEDEDDPVQFRPQPKNIDGGMFGSDKTVWIPEETEYFETMLLGGVYLNNENNTFKVTKEELAFAKELHVPVVIYAITAIPDSQRHINDISAIDQGEKYFKDNLLEAYIR